MKKTQIIGDISGFADLEGSEVRIVPGVTTYEYNELNQLINEKTPEGSIIYTYDTDGNLISKQGSDKTTYMYDGNNRLHLVTIQEENSVTTERYTYDYAGNRTSKTVNEEATEYYVVDVNSSLSQVSAKVDLEGNVITSYVRGSDLVSMETEEGLWYYIADGHGSIRALVNVDGDVTDTYSYDAFGNTLKVTGITKNDYRYTGEEYNETTGLYYLRARYMDPTTGTFISMDSYPGSLNDPTSLHKYLYAHANPVMNTDPTGYFAMADFSAATAIQSVMSGISINISIGKILAVANVVCTVYDVGMQIKDVILGGGSVFDIMFALAQGVVVGYALEHICNSPLGMILRPVLVVMGVGSQFDQLMEAFESGDPVEIAVRITQMALTVYALFQQCFTGDTLVATEDGLQLIEDIGVGDYVWSEKVETGEQSLQKVSQVFVSQTNTLVYVKLSSGKVINTTEGHPFYTEEKGWCVASELEAGDTLRTQSGEMVTVAVVTLEKLDEPVKVYNLEVEDGHTYYVADDGVLVHNMCNTNNGDDEKTSLWNKIKSLFSKNKNEPIGPDFVPNGKPVQEGVNPNSLTPTKDLSTLDDLRMFNAVKFGGNKPIIVDNLGNVLDGHHRLKYAIINNIAVDVSIGY